MAAIQGSWAGNLLRMLATMGKLEQKKTVVVGACKAKLERSINQLCRGEVAVVEQEVRNNKISPCQVHGHPKNSTYK